MLDPRYGNNFIDANVLDRTGRPEDAAVDEILRLRDEGAFTVLLPHLVKAELEHPHTPIEVKRRAEGFIFSIPVELTTPELATYDKIRALIQGNAKPGQHDKDAFHLVESHKYGARFFITNDARLLKKADDIETMLPALRGQAEQVFGGLSSGEGAERVNQLVSVHRPDTYRYSTLMPLSAV